MKSIYKTIKLNHRVGGTEVDYPSYLGNDPEVEVKIRKQQDGDTLICQFYSPTKKDWVDCYRLGMTLGREIIAALTAKHVITQRHENSFGEILRKNGIDYQKSPAEWLNSLNTTSGTVYRYNKDGINRVAYEVSHVLAPDNFIMVSALFYGEPSQAEVRKALRQ